MEICVTNNKTTTYAFIGAGNMSGAILAGMINRGIAPEQIIATNRRAEKQQSLNQKYGVITHLSNQDAIAKADVIILGVKPQMMLALLSELKEQGVNFADKLIISVAAGLTSDRYLDILGPVRFIRSMPNTPSMIGLGMTGLFYVGQDEKEPNIVEQDKALAEIIFSAVGEYVWLEREAQIDDIAAVSGSGPAYYFLFMEAMRNKAIALGFSEETATLLAKQTAYGASKMAFESELNVEQLRRNVTSPGGTTAAAIEVFEAKDLRGIVDEALDAAIDKAKILSQL
mgnify:CR=1 FL=1